MNIISREGLKENFMQAMYATGKASVAVARVVGFVGGTVIAGSGVYALGYNFSNAVNDLGAYAYPAISISFGLVVGTVCAVPHKVVKFMNKII